MRLCLSRTTWRPTGDPRGLGGPGAPERRGGRAEVRPVRRLSHRRSPRPLTPRRLNLYGRPHIDLLRVAGALCRP
ncbi:putative leader peptide [Streptomyces sp. NPDC006631]|uniref:putative leader peptide n=1 Tax=Streptomyces sp. NPDC006631 TaxID=3364752 RepID=UPI0036B1134A